jgi:hypothetical protein
VTVHRGLPFAFALFAVVGCANDPSYEYVRCSDDAACRGDAHCTSLSWRDGTGSLCTERCDVPSDCPHDGRCLDVNETNVYLCLSQCSVDGDCSAGFLCQPLTTGGAVCLPAG